MKKATFIIFIVVSITVYTDAVVLNNFKGASVRSQLWTRSILPTEIGKCRPLFSTFARFSIFHFLLIWFWLKICFQINSRLFYAQHVHYVILNFDLHLFLYFHFYLNSRLKFFQIIQKKILEIYWKPFLSKVHLPINWLNY